MKGLKVIVLVIGFFLPFFGTGKAEEKTLTLSQAIDIALSNNPTLHAADNLVEVAKAKMGEARSGLLPQIDFYENFNRTNNPMMVVGDKLNQEVFSAKDFPVNQLNNPAPISNFNTQVVITQPIFDQGKTWVGMSQAKIGSQTVHEEREWLKQEVIFAVVKAYTDTVRAKEDLTLTQETEKMASAHVKLAEDLFQTGQRVKSDFLSAKVRLSEVKEMVIQSQNAFRIAQAALNKAMGVNQEEAFTLEGELGSSQESFDLKSLISEALEKRPDCLAMENEVKNGQQAVRMAKTNYLPAFNLMAQYDLNDRKDVWHATGESWTVGGIFHFNVFDGLNSTYKLQAANAMLMNLENQKEELRNKIELEVREAFHKFEEARERLNVTSEAIFQAEESLRIVEDRYKTGLTTMVEVLDNQVALARAKRNHLYALCDLGLTRANLDLVRGIMAPPPERERGKPDTGEEVGGEPVQTTDNERGRQE